MRLRSDGIETRKRILAAACEVFAEKGYRDATVAEICRRAKSNSASINYHFKDKESLYVAVWRHSADEALKLYPLEGGVPATAPAEERFCGFLTALLRRMTDGGRLGTVHRLRMMEMANPTGLIDQVRWQVLKPLRDYLRQLLRELLGRKPSARELDYCEMTVIGPCLLAQLSVHQRRAGARPVHRSIDILSYADHCARFGLAGLKAMGANGNPGRS